MFQVRVVELSGPVPLGQGPNVSFIVSQDLDSRGRLTCATKSESSKGVDLSREVLIEEMGAPVPPTHPITVYLLEYSPVKNGDV